MLPCREGNLTYLNVSKRSSAFIFNGWLVQKYFSETLADSETTIQRHATYFHAQPIQQIQKVLKRHLSPLQ
jgi:hypothetical protein